MTTPRKTSARQKANTPPRRAPRAQASRIRISDAELLQQSMARLLGLTESPLNLAAIRAFASLRSYAQLTPLHLIASLAHMPIENLLATKDQRSEERAHQKHHAAMRRADERHKVDTSRIRRELDKLGAKCATRKARTGTYYRTPVEERRYQRLYRELNQVEERWTREHARLEEAEDARVDRLLQKDTR